MSWLFSQALVEEYSADTCLDGEPFAQWNVMPTQQGFWRNDKMMDASRLSRFGPTLRLLTEDPGEAVLMSFLAAFPVRTSVSQERVQASRASDLGSGEKWHGLLARYDRASCSWKTVQHSFIEDLEGSPVIWPEWGFVSRGCLYQLPSSGGGTSEPECGWLPTPTASEGPKFYRVSKAAAHRKQFVGHGQEGLIHRAIKNVPAEDSEVFQANPRFYEEMLGWPMGWTDLKPLAMDKMQEWRARHFLDCQGVADA